MKFEMIDEKDAPENLSSLSDEGKERLALIRALKPGKVAKVAVENTTAARKSFKTALSRKAGEQKPEITLEMWGDDEFIYIRLAKPKEQTPA